MRKFWLELRLCMVIYFAIWKYDREYKRENEGEKFYGISL